VDRFYLQTFPDAETLCQKAADEFVLRAIEAVTARGRFVVALSGGSTPRRLYQLLSEAPHKDQIDWAHVQIFWGDERCVPLTDPESNYRMTCEALLDRVPIPEANVHRMQAERSDLDAAANDYQAELAHVLDISLGGHPPVFDLVLLGMGADGHTASLFPQTTALNEQRRWVVPNAVPKLKTNRLTLTYPVLNQAREVLFLVAGADKTDRLFEVFTGPADPARLPSQRIAPLQGKLMWFVDRAAVARLLAGLIGGDAR